jgi:hypothetical protein
MTTHHGRLQPLLVGVAMRQALSPTGRAQTAMDSRGAGVPPTWASALLGSR